MPISEALIKEIEENSFCEKDLKLVGKLIDDNELSIIIRCLSKNKYIKRLILAGNEFGDKEISDLANLENIEELNISDTKITDLGAQTLISSNLIRLDISVNNLSDEALKAIQSNYSILELNLSENNITDKGLDLIAKNKSIKKLILDNIQIPKNGIKNLLTHSTIETLSLKNCAINDEMAEEISKSKSLREITLSYNRITAIGVNALIKNSNIESLYLCKNRLDDSCVADLISMKNLKNLSLCFNKLTDYGANLLIKHFYKSNMENLNVSDNLTTKSLLLFAKKSNPDKKLLTSFETYKNNKRPSSIEENKNPTPKKPNLSIK